MGPTAKHRHLMLTHHGLFSEPQVFSLPLHNVRDTIKVLSSFTAPPQKDQLKCLMLQVVQTTEPNTCAC